MKRFPALLTLLLTAACAQQPIVDTRGVNMARYDKDRIECEAFAQQVKVGQRTAGSAAAGAAVGAVIGAAVGNSDTAQRGAGAGAVVGASKGGSRARHEQQSVVRNCLRHRGYAVLN